MSAQEPSASDLYRAAVGERVYLWRLALRMSRTTLAEKAGVSADYVYRLEQGWANPRLDTMQALATALETTVQELLNVDGEDLGVASAAMKPS